MKKSYGVACLRYNNYPGDINYRRYEILLIEKRYTYQYAEFVLGKYNKNHTAYILSLMNKMSAAEKLALSSGNFGTIWYQMWGVNPEVESVNDSWAAEYAKRKRYFSQWHVRELRELLSKSRRTSTLWEIPKGRLDAEEEPLETAIREFNEEAGICKTHYQILDAAPFVFQYRDANVNYVNHYYLAAYLRNYRLPPPVDYRKPEQLREVIDIRWMSVEDVRQVGDTRLLAMVKSIFKIARHRYRLYDLTLARGTKKEEEVPRNPRRFKRAA